jgi:hypothetical protein
MASTRRCSRQRDSSRRCGRSSARRRYHSYSTLEGITRYPRSIEETVYFSVLETVERARMSGAREVEARLAGVDGELLIEVGLDGVTEIDLTAVSDRIDASGGMLRIDQTDGGTALTARLPVLDSTAMASEPSDLVSEPS